MKTKAYIDFIEITNNRMVTIEGYLGGLSVDPKKLRLMAYGASYRPKLLNRVQSQDGLERQQPISGSTFKVDIPCQDFGGVPAKIAICIGSHSLPIHCNRFAGFAEAVFSSKRCQEFTMLLLFGRLYMYRHSAWQWPIVGFATVLAQFFNWRIANVVHAIGGSSSVSGRYLRNVAREMYKSVVSIFGMPQALGLRLINSLMPIRYQTWLLSDRVDSAGDNGEALWKHLLDNDTVSDNTKVYFVLSRKSKDYKALKRYPGLIAYGSLLHKWLILRANKLISSHADIETFSPFGYNTHKYYDLMKYDFVFLQHGVIRHDLSSWLNRYNRNISLFITTSNTERDSILALPYYYNEDQVQVTGMPRYDLLQNNSDSPKTIVIAPTYRKYLLSTKVRSAGGRAYNSLFKSSEYFRFYNELIADERLNKSLSSAGITGLFVLHPLLQEQARDFAPGPAVQLITKPNYRHIISSASMLVSDHSSLSFDFAYLHKPVLYAHFDVEEFYASHSYTKSNHFTDEDDGFGEVAHDLDSTVDTILNLIRSNFTMSRKYSKRIDTFFRYNDSSNSQRVIETILALEKN